MLSVSNEYLKSIVSDTRDMPYRVTLEGGFAFDKTKMPSLSLDENVGGNEGVALGTANSATLRFTLKDADAVDYSGMLVEPESGLVLPDGTVEWLPLGKFWITDYSTSNDYKTVSFVCADGMYHMTGEYVSKLTYPAHVRDVAHEIVAQSGVEFVEPSEWPEVYLRRKPESMTHREAIGHVAGCCGCNARFNRYGKLEFTWYSDSGITISRSIQYLDGLTKLNYKPLEVNFEITGQKELYTITVVSDGNGGITATPGSSVVEDETVVLSVNPFSGYELATIYAETEHGEKVTLYQRAEGGYTFVQPDSNVTVTASFRQKEATLFQLTVRAFEGGSIDYERGENENYFSEGDEVSVTITPDSGKQVDKIVTTPHGIDLSNGSFTMPKSDVTITVYFKEADIIVTPYSWLQKPPTPPTDRRDQATFSAVSDSIIIDCEVISVSTEGDTLFLESERITARGENDSIILSIDTTPLETEKVTLTYTNPLIYEKMVESISNCVRGVVYTPARIKYRGNPALQAGDIVVAPDRSGTHHNILIIQQTLNFGGGLNGEISSPGKTEKSKSFSSVSPVTTQIKKEVKESNAELEQRLASNNALVFGSMYKELGEAESKIASVVEWQGAANATMARIEQTADENSGKIALVVGQNGIVNENGAVQGNIIVEAINGETTATIEADKINFEGQEVNIKVPATNITGQLNANQINADGIEAKDVRITGDITINSMLLEDCVIVAGTDTGTSYTENPIAIRWNISGVPGNIWCAGETEKAVPRDTTISVVANNKIYSTVIPKGEKYFGFYVYENTTVINRPSYIYYYEDDTFMTVSKGIMPYVSGDVQLGAPNHRWKEIYADTATINISDEREKHSISEIPEKFSEFFYKLKPVIYKLNNGTSDRFHVGFGAQTVENAMTESGIDSQEFAGLIKSPFGDDYKYGLRYSEFIALAVLEIQKLNKKIAELEERIK